MKKRCRFSLPLLAAMLTLSLAACGGSTSAPAEQPAEPASGAALPAPYYLAFAPGDTAEQDIDGDGDAEAVRLWLEPVGEYGQTVHLSVDGEDLTKALTEGSESFDCPDDACWLLTDIDTGDGVLEIAVQDWGPSHDLTTRFYHYGDGTLRPAGFVEGFVRLYDEPAGVSFDGQGTVHSWIRFSVLQTWWGKAESAMDETGVLVFQPQTYYESTAETPQKVRAITELSAYDAPAGQQTVLPAGTELEVLGTDNVEWVKARTAADGQELWLRVDPTNPFRVEAPAGFVNGWEALDGLLMAD